MDSNTGFTEKVIAFRGLDGEIPVSPSSSDRELARLCLRCQNVENDLDAKMPAAPLPQKNAQVSQPRESNKNKKYSELRDREYLLESEVKSMMRAAKTGRWGHRDALLILMGYRHGLRISELVNLRWQQVDFKSGHLHVRRIKGSRAATHPIAGDELRSLRQLLRKNSDSPYLFNSERGGPMTPDAARKMIRKSGEVAGLQFPVHPHMLRHGCGYYLAAKGIDTRAIQDYLGHANIHHTVRYTQLAPQRFDGFWED